MSRISLDAALAAVSGAAAGAAIYVHRNQSFRLPGGLPVPDVIEIHQQRCRLAFARSRRGGSRLTPEDTQTIQTSDAQPAMLIAVNRGQEHANCLSCNRVSFTTCDSRFCVLMHASWTSLTGEGRQPFSEVEPKLPSVTEPWPVARTSW